MTEVPVSVTRRGWWRRNAWGLLTVLPLALVASAIGYADAIQEDYWSSQPRHPVVAAADEVAEFAGARVRLVELAQATDLVDFGGRPVRLPDGVQAWRAEIEFDAPDQEAMAGCRIELEDHIGRIYSDRPDELATARTSYPTCVMDSSADTDPRSYRTVVYFATPASSEPVAVRISWPILLPAYLRLQV